LIRVEVSGIKIQKFSEFLQISCSYSDKKFYCKTYNKLMSDYTRFW